MCQSNRSVNCAVVRNSQVEKPDEWINSFLDVTIRSISVSQVGVPRVGDVIVFSKFKASKILSNFAAFLFLGTVFRMFRSQFKSPNRKM